MKVAVITPYYSESTQTLYNCWKSVNNQTYQNYTHLMVAGSKAQNVGALITRLKGLRLIYPDGTVHNLASQFLQSIIMGKLRQATPRSAKVSPARAAPVENHQ